MPGSGKLTVTGKLGDVMQESAQAAMSYVRSRAMRLGLDTDFYQKIDLHIHVPEGAIPKDGPSAGITMATSIVSALLKIPVNRQLAMTGEITLRGRVLPIGGLTEKLLAAKRGNITQVLVPRENERDLKEVPQRIRGSLSIDLVDNVDEVLQKALLVREGEELFKDVPLESIYKDFTVSSHNTPAH
jgi:ATP-dependent Lon protease